MSGKGSASREKHKISLLIFDSEAQPNFAFEAKIVQVEGNTNKLAYFYCLLISPNDAPSGHIFKNTINMGLFLKK